MDFVMLLASVIKQYNLAVVKCCWCWEGNCGLTSHWSCITVSVVHSLTGSKQLKGR